MSKIKNAHDAHAYTVEKLKYRKMSICKFEHVFLT